MFEMTRIGNWLENSLHQLDLAVRRTRATSSAAICSMTGMNAVEALADELVGDDVAHPVVPRSVAVLEDVRTEDVRRPELVRPVGS